MIDIAKKLLNIRYLKKFVQLSERLKNRVVYFRNIQIKKSALYKIFWLILIVL